jgi:hypothetical protein
MELQRAWLATYLEDGDERAARRRNNVLWRLLMSIISARSMWIAAFGIAAEWWRQRKVRAA